MKRMILAAVIAVSSAAHAGDASVEHNIRKALVYTTAKGKVSARVGRRAVTLNADEWALLFLLADDIKAELKVEQATVQGAAVIRNVKSK